MGKKKQKTVTLEPPSLWAELSAEQLIYIQSLNRGEMEDIIYRMHIFLHLADLELCGESYIEDSPVTKSRANSGNTNQDEDSIPDIESIEHELKWMEEVMAGEHRMIVLRKIQQPYKLPEYVHLFPDQEETQDEDSEENGNQEDVLFQLPFEQFFEAVRQYTEFIDDPYHLEYIPMDTIDIGDHNYQMPRPFISSLTYEQYQNAQMALGYFWNRAQGIEQKMQELAGLPKDRQEDEEFMAPHLKQIAQWNKDMKKWQELFMAHVLTLGHSAVEEREIVKPETSKKIEEARKRGEELELTKSDFVKKKFYKTEYSYNADEVEQLGVAQEMKKAPVWLFPVLHQNFQSSMIAHKKNFPLLFSGSGGGGASDPVVSMINTINAVMKWQTYASQQAVRDDNAISVFAVLNNMSKEAKEMEEANRKMKSKSKR